MISLDVNPLMGQSFAREGLKVLGDGEVTVIGDVDFSAEPACESAFVVTNQTEPPNA